MNFEGLAAELLTRAGEMLTAWSPGGRIVGREYTAGGVRGGPGDSFRCNIESGKWSDFATGESGGDLISLYAQVENIKNGDAAKKLADIVGFKLKDDPTPRAKPIEHVLTRPPTLDIPSMRHPKWGQPSQTWAYKDSLGVLFHVARYESDQGKQFCPWSWSATISRWVAKAWSAPRPLYGLDDLTARPTAPVVICEGEKATDGARKLIGGAYACVSWLNGAKAYDKADWSVLKGRKALIWPDADDPGSSASAAIGQILLPICESIKILDVTGQPDKWDAANAVEEGWDYAKTAEWAKPRARIVTATAIAQAPGVTAAAQVNVTVTTGDEPLPTASQYAVWEGMGLACTGQGNPYANQDNVIRVIEKHTPLKDLLWFDEFHQKYFTLWNSSKPREWEDVDTSRLTTYMQRKLGMAKMSDDIVHKGCVEFAKRHIKNEPRDWMDSLKWDGEKRVQYMLPDAFGADGGSEYVLSASKNFWVSMIARIYQAGCKVDNMVILEGPQGKYKSTALDIIGGKWFAEASASVMDKDFFLDLRGKLIIEIAELDSFKRRAEATAIKRVITCRVDRYRAPYERSSKDHARSSIFVATTNEHVYLFDDSGGRRFWPIICQKINPDWIAKNRDQLFAEAVAMYKEGAKWWEMPKDETEREQEKRRNQDEWENIIGDFLVMKTETTIREIASDGIKIEAAKLDKGIQMRIAGLLRNLGWDKLHREDVGGKQGKIWFKKE